MENIVMNKYTFEISWIVFLTIVAVIIYICMAAIHLGNLGKPLYRDQYKCAQY